jgi:hypothetical protein
MTTNNPADQPYGYAIDRGCIIPSIYGICILYGGPRYFLNPIYKFHFIKGTDDVPGDGEFEAVREAIKEWNSLRGFSFKIEEEPKPSQESSFHCKLDYHNHIGWRYPQAALWNLDECFSYSTDLVAITRLWPELYGSEILDADIAFNDNYDWNDTAFIKMIALHELGHVISLSELYEISDHDQDKIQIMHAGYQIEWGDKAGARWMYPTIYNAESSWFSHETGEADTTIGYIDNNSRPDLVVAWIDDPLGPNWIYYKIGWNLDQDGYASNWSPLYPIPGSIGDDTPGLAIALTNLDNNPRPDLFVAWLERGSCSFLIKSIIE